MPKRNDVIKHDPVAVGIGILEHVKIVQTRLDNAEAMLKALRARNQTLERENEALRAELAGMRRLKSNVERLLA